MSRGQKQPGAARGSSSRAQQAEQKGALACGPGGNVPFGHARRLVQLARDSNPTGGCARRARPGSLGQAGAKAGALGGSARSWRALGLAGVREQRVFGVESPPAFKVQEVL